MMAISGCHFDYVWNEVQYRNGEYTYDSDLEAGRHRFCLFGFFFLTWILTWQSGHEKFRPRQGCMDL